MKREANQIVLIHFFADNIGDEDDEKKSNAHIKSMREISACINWSNTQKPKAKIKQDKISAERVGAKKEHNETQIKEQKAGKFELKCDQNNGNKRKKYKRKFLKGFFHGYLNISSFSTPACLRIEASVPGLRSLL